LIIKNNSENIYYEEVINLQKELTKRVSLSPENGGDGEMEVHNFLKKYAISCGFDSVEGILVPDERVSSGFRPSLIVTINGAGSKRVWFMTHTDVVPAGEESLWKTPPHEAAVVGDKIYGRGTEDNRQSLISTLLAAKYFVDQGITPPVTIKLLFVADEETGSEYGIKWIMKNKPDIFDRDDIFIVPDHGDPLGDTIEIAEKGILWITCRISGKQSHGSRPDLGINAARAASYLTVEIDNLRNKYNAADETFDYPYSSFEPTKRIGSITNMNTISGEEVCGFDCRILPCYDVELVMNDIKTIIAEIEKNRNVKIDYTIDQKVSSSKTAPDSPVVRILSDAVKKITGVTPRLIGVGGGTVASPLRSSGFDAALWSTIESTMHSPNEYSSVQNTLKDMSVFVEIVNIAGNRK